MNPVDAILANLDPSSPFGVGVVKTVTAGAAADGNAAVVLRWYGSDQRAGYAASYTPVVGHVVLVARTQPLTILCRVIGAPTGG